MPRGSSMKGRNRTRDLDQIYEDKQPENIIRRMKEATEFDEDKPALGQYFCLPCDKYFCDEKSLQAHIKQKPHKRRLKALETEPHSQEIADWAAGVGSRKLKRKATAPQVEKMEIVNEVCEARPSKRLMKSPSLDNVDSHADEPVYLAVD